ncbi:helix-turn-helix domain-containing protein [Xylophilus rhododendri]|uniref:Helix-turn-helix domain-containing protein n=1 Tax=Xylophilus rhododendri TaxID=2697032 RepID=A0A857J3V7_9BURK|nr:helix-turn-helix domain-containing protein [Xylophilus rhododendri]QHI98347.1 helix-turn-helix domain-containing protein [Xylophilus rhododendri]
MADVGVSTVVRAFAVLDLFSLATPVVGVDDVVARLGYTRSTAYRYMRELVEAGLVTPWAGGSYSLGARIIELERLTALTDPLYRAGREVMDAQPHGNSALLLHKLYSDKVLCIYKAGPDVLEHAGSRITIRRARGIPFPLYQGAASLVMLPYLSPHRIRQTYLRDAAAIRAAGLGDDWEGWRRTLIAVRKAGHAVSNGQITPSVSGVAVAIVAPDGKRLLGSLARCYPTQAPPPEGEEACARDLARMARDIAARYGLAVRRGAQAPRSR